MAALWLMVALAAADPASPRRTPVVEVVEKAGPTVVNIAASARETPFARRGRGFEDWERFFGGRPRPGAQSLGSGVLIDEAGLVVTNEHVVASAGDITVVLSDRRSFRAELVGAAPDFDLAVLRLVDAPPLPAAELGASDRLMIGEPVVAIGNPFGLTHSVTTGVVSALHRVIEAGDRIYEDFIQTDAAINPGNSGGALFDIEGRLIGVNTAIHSEGVGIGFAIPIDKVRAVVQEVLQYGEVRPVYTGLVVAPGEGPGAAVLGVIRGSPAERAGVQPQDRILDLGGQEVKDGRTLRQILRALVPGRPRTLLVASRGGGDPKTVTLEVDELDLERAATVGRVRLGVEVAPGDRGVVLTAVDRRSDLFLQGVRPGDLLLGLAGRRLARRSELSPLFAALHDADRASVLIGRSGRAYALSVALAPP